MPPAKSRWRSELGLMLPALFIAFVIWVIAKIGELATDLVSVPVQIIDVPENMEIDHSPEQVQVRVQFPEELRNLVLARNFSVQINAEEVFSADQAAWTDSSLTQEELFRLEPRDIRRPNLPAAIRVLEVTPAMVRLTAKLRTATAQVEVVTTGTLPPHLELTAPPRPTPAEVVVTGSPAALTGLTAAGNRIRTEPIYLDQIQNSGQKYPSLILPDGVQPVNRENAVVTVNIGVTERRVQRPFDGVEVSVLAFSDRLRPVVTPTTVTVVVEGPNSALDELEVQDLEVVPVRDPIEEPGRPQDLGVEARLKRRVPGALARQLSVIETIPAQVRIEFVPVEMGLDPSSAGDVPTTATPGPSGQWETLMQSD